MTTDLQGDRRVHLFTVDPSALQTAFALRQAIWRKTDPAWPVCGVPAVLYSDYADPWVMPTSPRIALPGKGSGLVRSA